MSEIRIYVEGGGKRSGPATLRRSLNHFFAGLVMVARDRGIGWQIIPGGSRNDTFDNFERATRHHPAAFNVLLVDSEAEVVATPWSHVRKQDRWQRPRSCNDDHCQLMVQAMEAWILADRRALRDFFGTALNVGSLPSPGILESIRPADLLQILKGLTRRTRRGDYDKLEDGARILELSDPLVVRRALPSCDRFFATIERKLSES